MPAPDRAKMIARYRKLAALARDPSATDNERKIAASRLTDLIVSHPEIPVWAAQAEQAERAAEQPHAPPPPPAQDSEAPPRRTGLPPDVERLLHTLGFVGQRAGKAVARDLDRTARRTWETAQDRLRERAEQAARGVIDDFFDRLDSPGRDDTTR